MKSIRTFFIAVTVLITVIIFTFQAGFSFISFSKITYDSVEENLMIQAEKEAAYLDSNFNGVAKSSIHLADIIATMEDVNMDMLLSFIATNISKEDMIFGAGFWMEPFYFDSTSKYFGPYLYKDDQSNPVLTWDYSNSEYDYFQQDWYKVPLNSAENVVFNEPFFDSVSGITMMTVASPIKKDGQPIGVTTYDIGLEELQNYVENIKIGKTGNAFIVTQQGYYWASKDSEKNLTVKISEDNNKSISDFGADLLKNRNTDIAKVNENGKMNYMVYTPIGNTGLSLVTVMPEKEAIAEVQKVFIIYFSVFIVSIILFIIAFSFLFQKKLINPLKAMSNASQKLAIGDVAETVELNKYKDSNNEIGLLSKLFIDLSQNIREKANAIEKIASGDLSNEIIEKSDKDILAQSMKKVVKELRELVEESKVLANSAIEGNLENRGNSQNFEGVFSQLIEGTNGIINTLVGHIDSIPTPVVFMDNEYVLKYANDMATKVVNMKKENMIGQKCYDLLCSNVCDNDECPGRISFSQSIISEKEATAGPVELLIKTVPYKDMDDKVIGIMEMLMDQSEIKQAQKKSQKQAEYQNKEVKKLIVALEKLAKGNLDIDTYVEDADSDTKEVRESFKVINNSLDLSVKTIKSYINELSEVLSQIAEKDLSIGIDREYLGDFITLKESINFIIQQLSNVLSEINASAEQVETGADQVASSSQGLSQGSSEQAGSVEEISASITQVAEQTKENAVNANKANELSIKAKTDAQNGNTQMAEMLKAMNEIKESSKSISNIIKVIDEIAFQTNILALNAAVEAARAGEHGKGFAVVAEEVRNLAARSAKAAKETTDLIDNSIDKVEEGYKMANDTAEALSQIVSGVTNAVEIVGMIANASNEQANAISEINRGIEQVSDVTQSNTATAEESASASEEMAGQAQVLKGLIQEFKLKNTTVKRLPVGTSSAKKLEKPKSNKDDLEILLDDDSFGKY